MLFHEKKQCLEAHVSECMKAGVRPGSGTRGPLFLLRPPKWTSSSSITIGHDIRKIHQAKEQGNCDFFDVMKDQKENSTTLQKADYSKSTFRLVHRQINDLTGNLQMIKCIHFTVSLCFCFCTRSQLMTDWHHPFSTSIRVSRYEHIFLGCVCKVLQFKEYI